MRFLRQFFGILLCLCRSFIGHLQQAEIRMYAWDGETDLWHRTSWTDFYGEPYRVTVAAGEVNTTLSGWVIVESLSELNVTVEVEGSNAACVGQILVQFQGGQAITMSEFWFEQADYVISIDTDGTNVVYGNGLLQLHEMSFLRVSKITSLASHPVTVRVFSPSTAKPVIWYL